MSTSDSGFSHLGIKPDLNLRLIELGYETPTPIQCQSIPILLKGKDLVAQAQTGTGKTASFALPILMQIDTSCQQPQALIITPTRELAIQVAEAFQSYAKGLDGFRVAPIYGGQDYNIQLRALKRGSHVIVGTPGRLIDHLERGSLNFQKLRTLVLDEGDEMLKMGFVDDIERILGKIEHKHQTALFSATMPASIQRIAKRYMNNAEQVSIKATSNHAQTIEQACIRVTRHHKLEALTRLLEVEEIQAAIIFVRTKNASSELAEKLLARGHSAAALNGDMNQSMREKIISRLKKGSLDILVATDVAARGIDVERISHVINYDIPYDAESYIHRIGRTGRAGRHGKAFLFVEPREGRLLKDIERATGQSLAAIAPPTVEQLIQKRQEQWSDKIAKVAQNGRALDRLRPAIEQIEKQRDMSAQSIAAALLYLLEQSNPLPQEDIDFNPAQSQESRSRSRPPRNRTAGSRPNRKPSSSRRPSDRDASPFRKKTSSGRKKSDELKPRSRRPADPADQRKRAKPSSERRYDREERSSTKPSSKRRYDREERSDDKRTAKKTTGAKRRPSAATAQQNQVKVTHKSESGLKSRRPKPKKVSNSRPKTRQAGAKKK